MNTNKRKPGRPPCPPGTGKKMVSIRLSPWIIRWLQANPQSQALLIEQAVIKHYNLTKGEK